MRPLIVVATSISSGAALGVAARSAAQGDARRAMFALVVAFGAATCFAAAWNADAASILGRCRAGALVLSTTFAAAWCAVAVSGRPSLVGGAAVVAAAAVVAFGSATLCRDCGVSTGRAAFVGAAVPVASAALLFVADPFVEWNGATTSSAPTRAALVVTANPIASIASDVGIDWQRSDWLYNGPPGGAPGVHASPGLSVVGQFYPSRATPAWTWALAAATLGLAALAAAPAWKKLISKSQLPFNTADP